MALRRFEMSESRDDLTLIKLNSLVKGFTSKDYQNEVSILDFNFSGDDINAVRSTLDSIRVMWKSVRGYKGVIRVYLGVDARFTPEFFQEFKSFVSTTRCIVQFYLFEGFRKYLEYLPDVLHVATNRIDFIVPGHELWIMDIDLRQFKATHSTRMSRPPERRDMEALGKFLSNNTYAHDVDCIVVSMDAICPIWPTESEIDSALSGIVGMAKCYKCVLLVDRSFREDYLKVRLHHSKDDTQASAVWLHDPFRGVEFTDGLHRELVRGHSLPTGPVIPMTFTLRMAEQGDNLNPLLHAISHRVDAKSSSKIGVEFVKGELDPAVELLYRIKDFAFDPERTTSGDPMTIEKSLDKSRRIRAMGRSMILTATYVSNQGEDGVRLALDPHISGLAITKTLANLFRTSPNALIKDRLLQIDNSIFHIPSITTKTQLDSEARYHGVDTTLFLHLKDLDESKDLVQNYNGSLFRLIK
jgi:hypothetical protein